MKVQKLISMLLVQHFSRIQSGLVGGGHMPKPGEVSLAHNGALYLDEFPEFRRNVLDLLRQSLGDSRMTIAWAAIALTFTSILGFGCKLSFCLI